MVIIYNGNFGNNYKKATKSGFWPFQRWESWKMDGKDGNDTLIGGNLNDTLIGGKGNDSLSGLAGEDTADYSAATQGIKVNIGYVAVDGIAANTAANDGYGTKDTFQGIDRIVGSKYNDTIIGNDKWSNVLNGGDGNDLLKDFGGNDTLLGGWGNDTLIGGRGNDSLNGWGGEDTADYSAATQGIKVNINSVAVNGIAANTAANDGYGTKDTFYGIDRIVGSKYNDTIIGNDKWSNVLNGGDGNDLIKDFGGKDTLIGGNGNDTLYGGNDNDSLNGGWGNDNLYGQSGSDTIVGGFGNDTIEGGGYAYNSREYDRLTSSSVGDTDRFVLGNRWGSFYRGSGHATITDFDEYNFRGETTSDKLVLYGSSSNYRVSTFNGTSYVYYGKSDLIAVVDTVSNTGINLNEDVTFV